MKNFYSTSIALLTMTFYSLVFSQVCSVGTTGSPGTSVEDASVGTLSWSNPGSGVLASGGASSTSTGSFSLLYLTTKSTRRLVTSGFGFNLLSTDVVCGIQVTIRKRTTGSLLDILSGATDNEVTLYKNGTKYGSNYAQAGIWGGAFASYTYGGPNDLWGGSWIAEDINDPNFGAAIVANISGLAVLLAVNVNAVIDGIDITVYTYSILPVQLISFTGEQKNSCAQLSWSTASEIDCDYFTVEKLVGEGYVALGKVYSRAGTTEARSDYSFEDCDVAPMNYYRLVQTDRNGVIHVIGKLVAVPVNIESLGDLLLAPNPADQFACITSVNDIHLARVVSAEGKILTEVQPEEGHTKQVCLQVEGLESGVYTIHIETTKGVSSKKMMVK